jgi:hypothetical protein
MSSPEMHSCSELPPSPESVSNRVNIVSIDGMSLEFANVLKRGASLSSTSRRGSLPFLLAVGRYYRTENRRDGIPGTETGVNGARKHLHWNWASGTQA